ncbi:hypothetical protein BMS3Bbin03_01532 [bacterium BMS3Bbin03]|nr:hypothetical protein BMS3Bbin03_01532 [bacterium BMS3Bbin03]
MTNKKSIPFIFKFKTENNFYIYDINTNDIISVEKIIWDIVDYIMILGKNEIIEKFKNVYSKNKINHAIKEINNFKEKYSIFKVNSIKSIKFPLSIKEIEFYLNNNISHIILNVTDYCNLNCNYCKFSGHYYFEHIHSYKFMTEEIAKKSVDFLIDHSKNLKQEKLSIGFYGGEPLLNFRVIQYVVDYAKNKIKNPINFSISTNGVLINKKIAQFLIKNNFILNISIDGPKKINDRYRRDKKGNGSFDQISKNLKLVKLMHFKYFSKRVGSIVTLSPPFKLKEVYDFFNYFPDIPPGVVRISLVDTEDTGFYNQFNKNNIWKNYDIQRKEIEKLFFRKIISKKFEDISNFEWGYLGKSLIDIHTRDIFLLNENIDPNGICIPGFERPLIGTNGSIYICEKMGYNFPIGNIDTGYNIQLILKLMNDYIKISHKCKNCWAVRLCKACFITAKKGKILDRVRKNENCIKILSYHENSLNFYCKIMENNPQLLDRIVIPVFTNR